MIWCAEHESSAEKSNGRCDFAALGKALAWKMEKPCRMVEALLIVKESDRTWPEWARVRTFVVQHDDDNNFNYVTHLTIDAILDDIADARVRWGTVNE